MESLSAFLRSEEGPTTVEYAVMLGMILAACVVAIGLLGVLVGNIYDDASDQIGNAFQ
jgi:pilus assembly protein Flp/PilA